MSHASLAARYRPQTFAEVTGQPMVKTILSRAAAQDKVAPAYLFSGTRGVGKTTLARIFAKALNCAHAPGPEPCNTCDQCQRITQGNHVDVVEIDGASNTGVDDARRLKETIGYAPMEGRYKVFIIDEAHMLSRNAFNALLKTLEEPPPRAIFILATTEPHKFPPTIVSRCQHFVFQAQPEQELVEHLRRILVCENVRYDESALRLIARRAAGSVRDGMSLLGQTLALGGDDLNEAVTREVLGVAGQEAYERLLHAVRASDCAAVAILTRELLDRGIDIGFFLRELAMLWRNLFLIRQAGPAAAQAIDVPRAELDRLFELAPTLEPGFIHAAWQMVLESQRQVLTSLEPAGALELLLLNLALLPRLISLEQLSAAGYTGTGITGTGVTGTGAPAPAPSPRPFVPPGIQPAPVTTPPQKPSVSGEAPNLASPRPEPRPLVRPQHAAPEFRQDDEGPPPDDGVPWADEDTWDQAPLAPAGEPPQADPSQAEPPLAEPSQAPTAVPDMKPIPPSIPSVIAGTDMPSAPSPGIMVSALDWDEFLVFCEQHTELCSPLSPMQLRHARGEFGSERLTIRTMAETQQRQLSAPVQLEALHRVSAAYAGAALDVIVLPPDVPIQTESDLKLAMAETPEAKALADTFGAQMLRCIRVAGLPRNGC